jgi:uncharacterized protein
MPNTKGSESLKRELRTYTASQPLTLRTTDNGTKQISGYAIVWNSPSVDLGGFIEVCAPTMLDRTLKQSPDILALRDHKQELLLGRTTAGTLQLRTDTKGLAFTISLPGTHIGDDTAENVRLGNLSGVSFGFTTVKDDWSIDSTGNVLRTLLDVDLFEISPTSFPAYTETVVSTRSMPAALRKKKIKPEDLDPDLDDDDTEDGDDADEDDENEDDEDRCACACDQCTSGNCDGCTDEDCDDDDCQSDGCPQQDDARGDTVRLRTLFSLRMAV